MATLTRATAPSKVAANAPPSARPARARPALTSKSSRPASPTPAPRLETGGQQPALAGGRHTLRTTPRAGFLPLAAFVYLARLLHRAGRGARCIAGGSARVGRGWNVAVGAPGQQRRVCGSGAAGVACAGLPPPAGLRPAVRFGGAALYAPARRIRRTAFRISRRHRAPAPLRLHGDGGFVAGGGPRQRELSGRRARRRLR